LDLNNDGIISREELLIAYEKMMPRDEAESAVDHIMHNVDKNFSNGIDYSGIILE
jgi:Ca2+-binding EF-hand superfamily protein